MSGCSREKILTNSLLNLGGIPGICCQQESTVCSEHSLFAVGKNWLSCVNAYSLWAGFSSVERLGSCWDLMFQNWRVYHWPSDFGINLLFWDAYAHVIPFSCLYINYFSPQVLYFKQVISLWITSPLWERMLRSAYCLVSCAFVPTMLPG